MEVFSNVSFGVVSVGLPSVDRGALEDSTVGGEVVSVDRLTKRANEMKVSCSGSLRVSSLLGSRARFISGAKRDMRSRARLHPSREFARMLVVSGTNGFILANCVSDI